MSASSPIGLRFSTLPYLSYRSSSAPPLPSNNCRLFPSEVSGGLNGAQDRTPDGAQDQKQQDQKKHHHLINVNTLRGHVDSVTTLCFSFDGKNLATVFVDRAVRILLVGVPAAFGTGDGA